MWTSADSPEAVSDYDRSRRPLYSAGTGTCRLVDRGLTTETAEGELLKYDAQRLASAASIVHLRGTALASSRLWIQVSICILVSGISCLLVCVFCKRPELISVSKVREAVGYFSLFVAFMLAFFVSLAVERWWEVRHVMLGGLWSAIDDLTMVLAAHFPRREHRRLKTLLLRYCLLSMELMFMEARDPEVDLHELCRRKLLLEEEREKLAPLASKSQVVWVWIAGTLQRLAEQGKLSSRLLVMLYGICNRARASLGGVFMYLDTQLPFSYLHLLAVVVHINNMAVAVKCGVLSAIAIRNLLGAESAKAPVSVAENAQMLLLQLFSAVAVPLFYLGLLEVGVLASDPVGTKLQDFPRSAYHMWMRDECEAFQTTSEEAPIEIARVADQVTIKEQGFVHDCVVIV
eukprot:gnl/TRDRNA2_/TRDRNA2_188061_c0_seq1.p1 gnl/TRDRNA2_/TRDRNA2_188061_c0~~gnl/TRDRNA2_/TRDRNA2_188061_c0_seq1.p1  ORF type:complete len:403 (+),score=63.81 gnl/TRDRNA2_/TRDRNA2_188061_c0_seq1:176-1384(+)